MPVSFEIFVSAAMVEKYGYRFVTVMLWIRNINKLAIDYRAVSTMIGA
jgi:hypothetical protein